MNTQETIDLLNGLKLRGMAEAYKAITLMPVADRPDVDMGTAKLAEAERLYRELSARNGGYAAAYHGRSACNGDALRHTHAARDRAFVLSR